MSYCTNKLIHKLRKSSGVHASSRKPTKKVCDENETKKQRRSKKRCARKNVIDGRKLFIMPKQKTGENDVHELLGNNYGYNEGTICVLNGCIGIKRMVFRAWVHERAPLNSQWLVLRIGGADFLHC